MAEKKQERYINRDISWLEFNARVLGEAADKGNPLLERLKFIAIFSSNLDEFCMVRLAGIIQQQESQGTKPAAGQADEPETEPETEQGSESAAEPARSRENDEEKTPAPAFSEEGQ